MQFSKKIKRDSPLTVRLTASTIEKLKAVAEKNQLTQTDVVEQLIESAYDEMKNKKKHR